MGLRAILMLVLFVWQNFVIPMVSGNAHFRVEHKFRGKRRLKELRAHDARRHERMLGAVDVPLGGNSQPSDAGLYFTRIGLGYPPKEFHVQLDTGSQFLWVNGASCDKCPRESGLGIKLNFYDANSSSTAKLLTCGDKKCTMMYQHASSGCNSHMLCEYQVTYGDGSKTSGYFVEDSIHFNKVSGNQQTTTGNGSVVFGCAANQIGELTAPDAAVDGILGFGQRNSSVLSQLAAAGKVKRMFSHCLDSVNGGGIFSIGQLIEPKLNAAAPLIPHNVDDGFPNVILHFQNSLNLTVYPHDYLFSTGDGDNEWCIGWMNSKGSSFAVLGDFLFSNKVVFYDIENQSVGWTDYNCTSSIKVKDEESGAVYAVGAHDLSTNFSDSDSIPRRKLTKMKSGIYTRKRKNEYRDGK